MTTGRVVVAELGRVRTLGDRLRDARTLAMRTLRLVEVRLVDALQGEVLRGSPELSPGSGFRGYNVRGRYPHGVGTWLPRGGVTSLILGKMGKLQVAWLDEEGAVRFRPAEDVDLHPDDLGKVVETVVEAARRHVDRAEQAAVRHDGVGVLAARMAEVLRL